MIYIRSIPKLLQRPNFWISKQLGIPLLFVWNSGWHPYMRTNSNMVHIKRTIIAARMLMMMMLLLVMTIHWINAIVVDLLDVLWYTNGANLIHRPSSTARLFPGLLDHLRGTGGVVVFFWRVHMNISWCQKGCWKVKEVNCSLMFSLNLHVYDVCCYSHPLHQFVGFCQVCVSHGNNESWGCLKWRQFHRPLPWNAKDFLEDPTTQWHGRRLFVPPTLTPSMFESIGDIGTCDIFR